MTRRIVGWLLLALGAGGLLVDYHVIFKAEGGGLHALNALVAIGLLIGGIVALVPMLAEEIAKQLPAFGKAVTSVWPGGRRETDPPPAPPKPPANPRQEGA